MYSSIIASLLTFGAYGRQRRTGRRADAPAGLSDLNDHTLRDIGLARDVPAWDRRHILRL